MGIRINTNVPAINALRNYDVSSGAFAKSIERLSSGLRVNSAADDPAGLVISENLRAQINGIQQAVKNSQDAVNMVKTSEAALDEVQSLLRNARTLAVHAANTGVNDASELQADQTQINSILASINRIAVQTQFGNKRLLDGSAGVRAQVVDGSKVAGFALTGTFGGYAVASGNVTASLVSSATRAAVSGTVTYASMSSTVARGSVVINGLSISSDGTETLQTLVNKINAQTSSTGVVANAVASTSGIYTIQLRQNTYGANFRVVLNDSSGLLATSGTSTNVVGTNAAVNITMQTVNGSTTVQFTGGRSTTDTGLRLTDSYGNTLLLTEVGNTGLSTVGGVVANTSAGAIQFQVGGNHSQTVQVAINDMRASNLGTTAIAGQNLSTVDLTASGGADDAIRIIDDAITQLSKMRGDLGSFQANVLESNIRSLSVARENLAATESNIRDVDMAEEITTYTKLQILQQSGMSVLAQANQTPQSVLALLRGG